MAVISGAGGIIGRALALAFAAAKAGVVNLTRAMAVELGESGVRVNAMMSQVPLGRAARGLVIHCVHG